MPSTIPIGSFKICPSTFKQELEVWFYMNGPSKLHAPISSKPFLGLKFSFKKKKMYSYCSNQLNLSKYTWLER